MGVTVDNYLKPVLINGYSRCITISSCAVLSFLMHTVSFQSAHRSYRYSISSRVCIYYNKATRLMKGSRHNFDRLLKCVVSSNVKPKRV